MEFCSWSMWKVYPTEGSCSIQRPGDEGKLMADFPPSYCTYLLLNLGQELPRHMSTQEISGQTEQFSPLMYMYGHDMHCSRFLVRVSTGMYLNKWTEGTRQV